MKQRVDRLRLVRNGVLEGGHDRAANERRLGFQVLAKLRQEGLGVDQGQLPHALRNHVPRPFLRALKVLVEDVPGGEGGAEREGGGGGEGGEG